MLAVLVGACLGVATACTAGRSFACHDDDAACENAGVHGSCEPTGFCAFPDDTCASGRRYGALAGDHLAGTCTDDGNAETTANVTADTTADPGDGTTVASESDAAGTGASTTGPGSTEGDGATTTAALDGSGGDVSSGSGSNVEGSTGVGTATGDATTTAASMGSTGGDESGGDYQPCTDDTECALGLDCVADQCRRPCMEDQDCPDAGASGEPACRNIPSKHCVLECDSPMLCLPGMDCTDGVGNQPSCQWP